MTTDPRLPELFAQASELDGEARRAWLEELRGADAALAREVEELLGAAAAGERRFAHPAWEQLPTAGEDAPRDVTPDRIGPYRIRREIGRGGMGRVFLAEQEGAEFRRLVALKVLDRPASAEEASRRFRDEARILAALEHPGIARFYDAGRTADGIGYLALEYVEGEDLLAFVRGRELGLRRRVELFLEVLDAVDFAHRRLVVHRDLKPANVLVGTDGHVKLLDFGISKIVDPEAEAEEADTRTALRALTPAYASPEQLRGERATVATDVFSLGIVLYEILTGRRPFARAEALSSEQGARERDPAPPSTAARRAGDPRADPATGPPAPTGIAWRELAGDLDAVVLKALRSEPESRYRSAAAFAVDLRRWLRGEPVEARRGGRRYRLGKFVARHRLPVGLAATLVLALAAGAGGILVQSGRAAEQAEVARRQRDFALRQLARAEAINELNAFLLSDAAPGGRPFTAGELLDRAHEVVARQRDEPPADRAELLLALGRQYQTQDDQSKAHRLLTEAYELARRAGEPAVRARAACALASSFGNLEQLDRAWPLLAEGLALVRDEPQYALHRVFCLLRDSEVARDADDGGRAVASVHAAERLLRQSSQGSSLLHLRVAMDLAESHRVAGDLAAADRAFASAATRLEALGRGDAETAGTLLNNWALTVRTAGRPLDAERLFRRAVEIASQDGGLEGVSPILLGNLARTLVDLARPAEAEGYAEHALAGARRGGLETATTLALSHLSFIHRELGQLSAAARELDEFEARIADLPADHYMWAVLASDRGLLAEKGGDLAAARAAHDRAVSLADDQVLPALLVRRAALGLAEGRAEAAGADAARALDLVRRDAEPDTPSSRVGLAQLALARARRAQGRSAEAAAAYGAALAHLTLALGPDHPDTREARAGAAAGATAVPAR